MGEKDKQTSIRLSADIKARVAEIKRRTAVLEYKKTGQRDRLAGAGYEEVLIKGCEVWEAEIARQWTPAHQRLLKKLPPPATLRGSPVPRVSRSVADGILAEAREQGFGPDIPQDLKIAKAVELHAAGVTDGRIGELLGVSTNLVSWWRHGAAVPVDPDRERLAAEAVRLTAEGLKAAEIGQRLGVSRQQVGKWRQRARRTAQDGSCGNCGYMLGSPGHEVSCGDKSRLAQARSRSRGAAPVRHATPVKFQAPGRAS